MIEAKLVADGVGLPRMWVGNVMGMEGWILGNGDDADGTIDLSDHQTSAGLLRQLAVWAGDNGKAQSYSLSLHATDITLPGKCKRIRTMHYADIGNPPHNWKQVLAAILTHIGMDHAIRRALGWKIEPGTLADIRWNGREWMLTTSGREVNTWWFCADPSLASGPCYTQVPQLSGNTDDPAEALRIIYAELCRQ